MTPSATTGDPASLRSAVLDRLAVPDLDLATDRAEVRRLAATRRSSRRALGVAAIAVAVLVLAGGWAWLGGEDADELVADRDDAPATTVTRPPTTTSTTALAAGVSDVAPSSTTAAPAPTSTAAPAVIALATPEPPPPTPIDEPLRVQVTAVTPDVAAGDTAVIEVAWMHADHVGPAPAITIDWGDPAVAAAPSTPPAIDCAGAPRGAGDVTQLPFRYATTGRRIVRVTLDACRDGRPDGERVTVETTLEVLAPTASDRALRAVVLTAPRATHAGLSLPSLDDAAVELVPDGPGPTRGLAARDPLLEQVSALGPATVVLVGLDDIGTLRLGWPSSPCRSDTALPPPTPDGRPPVLELVSTC